MANKFTKSVLERQAKELREQQTPSQPTSAPLPEAGQPPSQPLPNHTEPERTTAQIKQTASQPASPDLTAFIVRDTGRTAKNKTFYLDAAVIEALHRCAANQKITDSKLVNDILRKVLKL